MVQESEETLQHGRPSLCARIPSRASQQALPLQVTPQGPRQLAQSGNVACTFIQVSQQGCNLRFPIGVDLFHLGRGCGFLFHVRACLRAWKLAGDAMRGRGVYLVSISTVYARGLLVNSGGGVGGGGRNRIAWFLFWVILKEIDCRLHWGWWSWFCMLQEDKEKRLRVH